MLSRGVLSADYQSVKFSAVSKIWAQHKTEGGERDRKEGESKSFLTDPLEPLLQLRTERDSPTTEAGGVLRAPLVSSTVSLMYQH